MDVLDFIKDLAMVLNTKNKVPVETYLKAANIQKIPYPLTPVRNLIKSGHIVLDQGPGYANLVVQSVPLKPVS
ncbi:hypothetical protein A2W13_00830 [Candidatus Woesebacteria bacterium RBG_16_36_11]|uniref:Uncharacterized protein n=3 Tax=Candidatus Woeseibacteriota TaxID=1752722 RepID=A0A1F7XA46_9BACT|nr:MAG: hypothetical protein A2Z67_00505 [Candidatus Woesebacteria bacterium RBG_13_36_22]OGM11258.1 MAG: hypothetical protein A2W13_00830 [Candidatus Woesebacteria bacterium RBG_16_36_11]OGM17532.1 MAG: hypothetical protein A2V55_02700 [Candidatus Woesebacteria bacterium RBG_19FT_COMBO_37_29]